MSKRVVCVLLLRLVVILPCLGHAVVSWPHNIIIARGGAASESLDDDDDDPRKKLPLHGLQPDKFVSLAPLIVAAVCSDGIVMIATHTSYLQEPLLMRLPDNSQDNSSFLEMSINTTDTAINSTQQQNTSEAASNVTLPRDVPLDFRGPFRIQSIDSVGSTLLCAGWKTDGDWLTQTCRDLAESEIANFGPPTTGSGYGRYIANEASFWMAQCAVSDQFRALSCVALLAVGGDRHSPGGYLWLVDATGAYRVRAHALGLGSAKLNQRLWGINFTNTTKEQAAKQLLELMMMVNTNQTKDDEDFAQPVLDSKALIEAAVLDSTQHRMMRIRQPFLGSKQLNAFLPATTFSAN